jgi:hypothetical protein
VVLIFSKLEDEITLNDPADCAEVFKKGRINNNIRAFLVIDQVAGFSTSEITNFFGTGDVISP